MMIKWKLDGAVDKSSADQEICNCTEPVKFWRPTPSGNGSYGRLTGSLVNKIWDFKSLL